MPTSPQQSLALEVPEHSASLDRPLSSPVLPPDEAIGSPALHKAASVGVPVPPPVAVTGGGGGVGALGAGPASARRVQAVSLGLLQWVGWAVGRLYGWALRFGSRVRVYKHDQWLTNYLTHCRLTWWTTPTWSMPSQCPPPTCCSAPSTTCACTAQVGFMGHASLVLAEFPPSPKAVRVACGCTYPLLLAAPTQSCFPALANAHFAENVRIGDRSTERKASEESPLVFAGVFQSVNGPGVVTVSADGALAVRVLPSPARPSPPSCPMPLARAWLWASWMALFPPSGAHETCSNPQTPCSTTGPHCAGARLHLPPAAGPLQRAGLPLGLWLGPGGGRRSVRYLAGRAGELLLRAQGRLWRGRRSYGLNWIRGGLATVLS